MTDKTLETKAVEILDASQTAIASFADKLTDLAKTYGPDVADAALNMARIDAASALVPAIFVLVALGVIWTKFLIPYIRKATVPDATFNQRDNGHFVAVFCGIPSLAGGGYALFTILDIWRWAGLFHPELWLAKKVLGL